MNSKDINTFENANINMFERNQYNLQKAPGQEEYEYEIDADFHPEQEEN